MLSKEENELLCRVGAGTLMGDLMRQYWLPFLYSWEVEPDGPPLRVRLLGEDLVVFRDSSGRVGLVATNCPHRGASLFFGRNEEDGLRCVYHGWKFDTAGNCVDMPSEPAESNFKDKIHHTAYRCAEQGGVVFAYMGPRQADPPGLPQLEWAILPEAQVHHEFKGILQCNYMQALEGDVDSAHTGFLHSRLSVTDTTALGGWQNDRAPRLEIVPTDYGILYAARRRHSPTEFYWRATQFLMPVHTHFPAAGDGTVPTHIWVPIDDGHTLVFGLRWHPSRELPDHDLMSTRPMAGMGPMRAEQTGKFFAHWWPKGDLDNDFLLDREVQRAQTFTGIPTIRMQDAAMTSSMGRIMDRSHEHLGTTDTAIIQTRHRMLRAAKALREHGTVPPGVDQPEQYRVRSCAAVLPEGVDWKDGLGDWLAARTDDVLAAQTALLA